MLSRLIARLMPQPAPVAAPVPEEAPRSGLRRAAELAGAEDAAPPPYRFKVAPPALPPGVAPAGVVPPVMAMDATAYAYAGETYGAAGFPGYPYLVNLSTRSEFRAFAAALSTELTREWIELTSASEDGEASTKLPEIEAELKRLNVRGVFQKAAEHDCYFGRAQLFVELKGHERNMPLVLSNKTVAKGSLVRVVPIEPMWTTPSMYNSLDPAAPDFYRPTKWYMLGQEVHASRMLTIVTRELPDMLKPAFNFGGMSLSQLAEPYVDNWLRTRQSVSDLINNFSITALATSMDQVLSGADDGTDLFARAALFTTGRSNKGLMLLDKEREELVQINTPLGGLHELQAQSQEQMCSVSRMPAIVLTGISPSGLNASSEGEIRTFYDWITAQQEAHYRAPLEVILKLVQLSLYGEIDEDIGFKFVPLYQMTPAEEAEIRSKNATSATAYINAGVIDPSEERERLARDPASGYQGLDTSVEIVPPTQPGEDDPDPDKDEDDDPPPAQDGWEEGKHPRADNGQFGSGSGGGASKAGKLSQAANKASAKADKANTAEAHEAALAAHADAAGEHSAAAFAEGPNTMGESNRAGIVQRHLAEMQRHAQAAEAASAAPAVGAHKDANGNERSAGLSPRESAIEGAFHDAVTADAPKLIAEYRQRFGNTIDPDAVKALDPNFAADPGLAAAVHEPSSRLAKMIYAKALKDKADSGDTSPTVFTAGGSGSGKSTTLPGALAALGAKPDGLIYDSVLSSPSSAKSRIDQALAATAGDVGIAYTNADIETALYLNAKRTRSVSIDTLMHAHVGASDTLRELAEHYKDNPRVKFTVMNNKGSIDQVAPGTIADVPKYDKFALREQLVKVAQGMLSSGKIDQAKYELLTR